MVKKLRAVILLLTVLALALDLTATAPGISDTLIEQEKTLYGTARVAAAQRLLAEDSLTVLATGERAGKRDVLPLLSAAAEQQSVAPQLSDFRLTPVTNSVYVLSYVVTSGQSKHLASSTWHKRDGKWLVVFHQGTTIAK